MILGGSANKSHRDIHIPFFDLEWKEVASWRVCSGFLSRHSRLLRLLMSLIIAFYIKMFNVHVRGSS